MKKEYSITLTADEITLMANCIAEQPYKLVAALIAKVQVQINRQDEQEQANDATSIPD